MDEKQINIRLPKHELEMLENYCRVTGRSKTDVLREFIRTLTTAKATADSSYR